MSQGRQDPRSISILVFVGFFILAALPSLAQKQAVSPLDSLAFASPGLRVQPDLASVNDLRSLAGGASFPGGAPLVADWDRFCAEKGGSWTLLLDRRSGFPNVVTGSGVPWVPGRGNTLSVDDIRSYMGASAAVDTATLERLAQGFLSAYPELFPISLSDLVLIPEASGEFGGYLWYVQFQYTYQGIPIENARIVLSVNNGNLVQFGAMAVAPVDLDARPYFDSDTAIAILGGFIGGFLPGDEWVQSPRLLILPINSTGNEGAYDGPVGKGMDYRLAYRMALRRPGDEGIWLAKVDAHTGEMLLFQDSNQYADVTGGVYPKGSADIPVIRPLPYARVTNGLEKFTDRGGHYAYDGGQAVAEIAGKYVTVKNTCAGVSPVVSTLSPPDADGNFAFGQSSWAYADYYGSYCLTPGVGDLGNTNSSRTAYYWLDMGKQKARGWLPANGWVNGNVTALVYASQGDCGTDATPRYCPLAASNAGILLHELGHNLDSNDGTIMSDYGSGEAYADVHAFLATHKSCFGGHGFWPGVPCDGWGIDPCTDCVGGMREADWAKHASNGPHKPAEFIPDCPIYLSYYIGPCGKDAYCEAQVVTETLWDLAVRDLPGMGIDPNTAWNITERLFYLSMPRAGSAFLCALDADGNILGSHGCGLSTWFYTFLVADDDDGNLTNGTPHGGAIYTAFNRHGIACPNTVTFNCGTCPALAAPSLTATAGQGQVSLS